MALRMGTLFNPALTKATKHELDGHPELGTADKPLANAHQTKDWVASTTSLMPLIQKCIAGTASTSAKQNRVASTNRAPRTPACRMA